MEAPFCIDSRRIRYQLHPITVFEILDHHRRRKGENRVFGLLVGRRRRRLIEVTGALNISVVIDEETEEITELRFLQQIYELHKTACPNDQIVGLYTTFRSPDFWFGKVHEAIGQKIPFNDSSLFLVVGCANTENRIRITGYTSKTMFGICRYVGVPMKLQGSTGENLGVWTLVNCPTLKDQEEENFLDQNSKLWSSSEVVAQEMSDMARSLQGFKQYVEDESQRREEVGWDLAAALSEVPCIPEPEFESMISGSIQDLLMTDFLAKLIQVHVNLAGKLGLQAPRS